ncbi:MAG: c-type cytochrome [Pseudomonadota bacterium]
MIKIAIATLLMLGMSTGAHAGNPQAGEEKSAACQGCHGVDGNSPTGIWPSLAGQKPQYLVQQLLDFQSGARKNETMEPMAAGLSKEDMEDIAAYFAKQKVVPAGSDADAKLISRGMHIYKAGNIETNLAACAGCHGPDAKGNGPAKFPALAGQQAEYIVAQFDSFKHSTRSNDMNGMMRDIAARISEDDLAAVAAYLANLGK